MRSLRVLALVTVATVATVSTGCSSSNVQRTTLTYCSPGGVREQLDVYTPDPAPTSPAAAVVYVHGGGWVFGSRNPSLFIGLVEQEIVGAGQIFVSVDYRLATRFRWPAQIEDVKCAIRFLRHEARTLGIDPGRIGAIGDSAGGQLVALAGLAGPGAGFDVGQYIHQSSAVRAVVDLYGPSDLTTPDWSGDTTMHVFVQGTFGQPIGHATPELVAASPVTYVTSSAPPFLLIQGADDMVVPPSQSAEMAKRLTTVGAPVSLVVVQGAGHGLTQAGPAPIQPGVMRLSRQIVRFLTQHLGE